jgi:hypothetical protein
VTAAAAVRHAATPVRWALATAGDDAEIRELLRRRPMDGRIRVAMTREPDSRIAAAVEGERHATVVGRDPQGRLLGFGSRAVRRVWLDGEPAWLGYLGQLRAVERSSGLRRLGEGYACLRAQRRPDELPFDLTAILADNRPARRLLERGLPGLPRYSPLAEVETLVVPVARRRRRRGEPQPRPLAAGELPRLLGFLRDELRRRPFAPLWSASDLAARGRLRGLGADDFRVVEEGGRIVGAAALWDQRAFKQTVVDGYGGGLRRVRPLVNLGLRALGRPLLPPPGSVLPLAFVAAFAVTGDDEGAACALVEALRREARRRGLTALVVAFTAGHPLRLPLRRRFAARPYRSVLYSVHWPDDPPPPLPTDAGEPFVEAALL